MTPDDTHTPKLQPELRLFLEAIGFDRDDEIDWDELNRAALQPIVRWKLVAKALDLTVDNTPSMGYLRRLGALPDLVSATFAPFFDLAGPAPTGLELAEQMLPKVAWRLKEDTAAISRLLDVEKEAARLLHEELVHHEHGIGAILEGAKGAGHSSLLALAASACRVLRERRTVLTPRATELKFSNQAGEIVVLRGRNLPYGDPAFAITAGGETVLTGEWRVKYMMPGEPAPAILVDNFTVLLHQADVLKMSVGNLIRYVAIKRFDYEGINGGDYKWELTIVNVHDQSEQPQRQKPEASNAQVKVEYQGRNIDIDGDTREVLSQLSSAPTFLLKSTPKMAEMVVSRVRDLEREVTDLKRDRARSESALLTIAGSYANLAAPLAAEVEIRNAALDPEDLSKRVAAELREHARLHHIREVTRRHWAWFIARFSGGAHTIQELLELPDDQLERKASDLRIMLGGAQPPALEPTPA